jgi:hypothetical protein
MAAKLATWIASHGTVIVRKIRYKKIGLLGLLAKHHSLDFRCVISGLREAKHRQADHMDGCDQSLARQVTRKLQMRARRPSGHRGVF